MTCATCRYFSNQESYVTETVLRDGVYVDIRGMRPVRDGAPGTCHRRPPTVTSDSSGEFPAVWENEWCGEWKANP